MLDSNIIKQLQDAIAKEIDKKTPTIIASYDGLTIKQAGKTRKVILPSNSVRRTRLGAFQ